MAFSNNVPGGVDNTGASSGISYNNGAVFTGNIVNEASGTITPTGSYSPLNPGTATGISVLKSGTELIGNIINSGTINADTIPGKQIGINIGEGATNSVNQNAGAVVAGSITNSGTINSQVGIWVAGNSSPLLSTVTGSIINATSGQINYTNVGINENWATIGGSITNSGTITGTGTAGINVAFADIGSTGSAGSGNIVNATGANIASSYIGIVLNGNTKSAAGNTTIAGSIINDGTITVGNQNTNQGIEVAAATVLGGVTNTGTINGAIGIEAFGASDQGGPSRIVSIAGNVANQGRINAVSTNGSSGGIEIFGYKGGAPAIVGGSITNSGAISVVGVGGTDDGILLAGVNVAGGITNSSTISVSGGAVNVGIAVASSAAAAANSSIGGSISNLGSITAGTGILVSGGSTVAAGIGNSGNIDGSRAAIDLTGEGSATTITQSAGTVTGSILLSSFADTLDVIGGIIDGDITGLGSSDTVEFVPGSGNTFTYANTISGVNSVDLANGELVLGSGGLITGNLTLSGTPATLELATGSGQISGDIAGATTGDHIDLGFLNFAAGDKAIWQQTGATGTLSVETGGGAILTVLALAGTYATGDFTVIGDNLNHVLIELGGPAVSVGNSPVVSTSGGVPVTLDSSLSVSDSESTTLTGATVQITSGTFAGDNDHLSANTAGTSISASYNGATETLTLSGTDTLAHYQSVLDQVTFTPSSSNPTNSGADPTRTVTWAVNDGTSLSAPVDTSVTIASNAPPPSNPPPPAGTAADLLMERGSDGTIEFYDIGRNTILLDGVLGHVDPTLQVAGVGGFNDSDTDDLLMRNSTTGAFTLYDVSNDNITGNVPLGQVGPEWTVSGLGDFSTRAGETDLLMRNSNTGAFEVYDIANNFITFDAGMGQVGLEWTIAGFGDFSTHANETDMLMRNSNTGAFELYDISNNTITAAAPMGQVGLEWSVAGFGDFSGNANETDMLMRNTNTGAFELYDISNNKITSSPPMGQVGLEWTIAGFGDFSGNPNETDILMRNSNNGDFELYDISNNKITSSQPMGQVGLEWSISGVSASPAAAPPSSATAQLTQALAAFAPANGALDTGIPLVESPSPLASTTQLAAQVSR
ncbi:MAG: hypothetical protein WAV27_08070 [Xanthobacteraceae bacterium]